jgi:hypothetical protein
MEARQAPDPYPESRDAAWLTPAASIGDAIVFLIFAGIGRASHGEAVGNAALRTVGTALPFLAGWFAAALVWRVYASETLHVHRGGLTRVTVTWITGAIIALTIRSILEHRVVPATFAGIAFGFNLVLLLLWRTVIVTLARKEP